MEKYKRIYKKPNLNKIEVNSLFFKNGTISNLDNFIKIDVLINLDEKTKTFHFIPLFTSVKDDEITFIFDNNIVVKKLIHSYEFSYKIQKTQIQSTDINSILNSETWKSIFASNIVRNYFNKKTV